MDSCFAHTRAQECQDIKPQKELTSHPYALFNELTLGLELMGKLEEKEYPTAFNSLSVMLRDVDQNWKSSPFPNQPKAFLSSAEL